MRLIPRTARGTVLTAVLVWLAAAPALWNTLAPRPRAVFPMTNPFVAGFTPDGHALITAARGGAEFVVRDAGDGRERARIAVGRPIIGAPVLSADGRRLAYMSSLAVGLPAAAVWDLPAGRELLVERFFGGQMALSPDGRWLVAHGIPAFGLVRAWDLAADPPAAHDVTDDFLEVRALSFAPDGRFVVAAGRRMYGRAVWWATDDWHEAGHVSGGPGELPLTGATFTPDGRLAVARDAPPLSIARLDPATGAQQSVLSGLTGVTPVTDMGLAAGGRVLAVLDYRLNRWTGLFNRLPDRLPRPSWARQRLMPTTVLFDAATGAELGRLPGQPADIRWSPDGATLATADDDGVSLWDLPPRVPVVGVAALAAVWTAVVAGAAWWRVRRLRHLAPRQ